MQDPGVVRTVLSLKTPERSPSVPLQALGGHQQSLAFLGLWPPHSTLRLHLYMACSRCICVSPRHSSSSSRHGISDLGITSLQDDLISTRLHLQRLHFQIRSPSQVWGLGSGHTWGNISTHYALRSAPRNGGSSGMAGRKRQEAGQCPRAPPGLSPALRG